MTAFNSFFIGGYNDSDNLDINLKYQNFSDLGITTVREEVYWEAVEISPSEFDFSALRQRIEAADEIGIQLIWDLCQAGFPAGLSPQSPSFAIRFAAYCDAFTRFYTSCSTQPLFVVPINEITFLSWHLSEHRTSFSPNVGFNTKYNLCRAAIMGINALRRADPQCRVILVEPLIRVHAGSYTEAEHLYNLNEAQFQVMDIIAGRLCPELGGSEGHLDILGFSYQWNSQWEEGGKPLQWPEFFERRVPLSSLLKMISNRYERPLMIADTGHFGNNQLDWIEEVVLESLKAVDHGVPLAGICITTPHCQGLRRCIVQTNARLEDMAMPLSASAFG